MNTLVVNKVVKLLKKTTTVQSIAQILKEVISHLRVVRQPSHFKRKPDHLGILIAESWKEQEAIGWENMQKVE